MVWKLTFQFVFLLIAVCKTHADTALNRANDPETDRDLLSFNDFADILGRPVAKPTPPPTQKPTMNLRPSPPPTSYPTPVPTSSTTATPEVPATPAPQVPETPPPTVEVTLPPKPPTGAPTNMPTFGFTTERFNNLEITLFGLRFFPTSQVQNFIIATTEYFEAFYDSPSNEQAIFVSEISTRIGIFEINSFPITGGVVQIRFNQTVTFLRETNIPIVDPATLITAPFATEERRNQYVQELNAGLDIGFRDVDGCTPVTGPGLPSGTRRELESENTYNLRKRSAVDA